MELERISVALRPRTPREAVDLGVVMLRANAWPVWSAWLVFTLPLVAACVSLGLLLNLPWLGIALIWWLKPLFDRVPLYVLSHAVFDHVPRWRETLRGQRQWRWRGTLAALTWRRLDSHRGLRLPLELLEGLPRAQRSARWRVLCKTIGGQTNMLIFGCLQLEIVLFLTMFLFGVLFVPGEFWPDSWRAYAREAIHNVPTTVTLLVSAAVYLAMSVIEPLYVAASFALYLTRRTQLEAWDIDLAFRRIRQRLQSAGRALVLLFACAAGLLYQTHAHAAATEAERVHVEQVFDPSPSQDDAKFAAAAAQVYRDPRFGSTHKHMGWALRKPAEPVQAQRPIGDSLLGNLFAGGLYLLMWLLLAVVLGALLVFVIRHAMRHPVSWKKPRQAALVRVHEMVAAAAMPDDLAGATRAMWQAGQRREALALLYRGSMDQVAAAQNKPLPVDATEADCLRRARALDDTQHSQRVVAIVRTWQHAAYADRFPSDSDIDALLTGWPAQHARQV
ncbi:DUF4129 domain-containing protein [Dyella tabacisoli]|uniref:DUF4129 domain-containing protein n=1 Tax=Dyella tabacisoli TaxID=2282381 RepID=A0A369UK16_9GAMM|nr:DUF4129 domain-containing protein [Dyella tabacisoli]RDD80455.1 DUF4129 domain-containing protein [Dyella tabacisoli]